MKRTDINCDQAAWLIAALRRLCDAERLRTKYPGVSLLREAALSGAALEIMDVLHLKFADDEVKTNILSPLIECSERFSVSGRE